MDHAAEGVQRLGGADVVGRLLAADVLLARLQGEHEAATAVDVGRLAGDPARHAPDLLVGRAEEAEGGAAVVEAVAERLALADGDVDAALARRAQDAERDRVAGGDQQGAGPVGDLGDPLEVLDAAEEARVLDEDGGGLLVDRLREGVEVGEAVRQPDLDHVGRIAPRVGLQGLAAVRVQAAGDDEAARAWSRRSPDSRRRRPSRGPRRARRSRAAGRSAPTSRSGTRTSPAARPARSPAGRACRGSGTPSAR